MSGGVGSDVGVENVIETGCNHPRGVEVAAELCEGDVGAYGQHEVTEKIDREGEVFGGLGGSEG